MARRPRFKQIEQPQLPPQAELQTVTTLTLEPSGIYTDLLVEHVDLKQHQAQDLVVERSQLIGCDLSSTLFPSLYLKDVRCSDITALNADWTKAQIERTTFFNCRLSALQLHEARLEHVVFYQCQLDFSTWWKLRARHVHFEQCRLVEASFEGADLRGVVLRECDLSLASFQGAKLKETDLRASVLQATQFNPQDLRGLILDASQVLSVVELLGISVQALEENLE